jgi:two-component system nitrogen regulation response regulator GlnG
VDIADLPPNCASRPATAHAATWGNAALASRSRPLLIAGKQPARSSTSSPANSKRTLIRRALNATGGRRIEAAHLLGIGRNTITRKIQELPVAGDRRRGGARAAPSRRWRAGAEMAQRHPARTAASSAASWSSWCPARRMPP